MDENEKSKNRKPSKPSKLSISIEETFGRALVCQICGDLYHGQNAVPVLREVDGSQEWVICPDCLSAGVKGAALIARQRAEELTWLAKQIKRLPEESWASTDDLQKKEMVLRGVAMGLKHSALERLDLPTLRELLGRGADDEEY